MDRSKLEQEFRTGLAAWRLGRRAEAADTFRSVVGAGSSNPRHLSYHGLMCVIQGDDEHTGLELCERAALLLPDEQAVHVNLARARVASGRKVRAVSGLRRALDGVGDREPILAELKRLNPRRRGPLPFLKRRNPINRALGRLLRRRTGSDPTR